MKSKSFERLLFDVLNSKDTEVKKLMHSLESKGYFKLNKTQKKIIQKDFVAFRATDKETKKTIKKW